MNDSLEGKVALVTGGRGGIGRAIALRLQQEGARVFTAQRGSDPVSEGISADVSDASAIGRLIDEVVARGGGLEIPVNNAGLMREASVEDMTLAEWERVLAVNLMVRLPAIKAALPHLRERRGTIVNIGSIKDSGANPAHAAYCAAKAGLHGLTRAVAVDHGHEGLVQRRRTRLDRHRSERRLHQRQAGPGRIPQWAWAHPSRRSDRSTGRGRRARRVVGLGRGVLRDRTNLGRGRRSNGEVESSLSVCKSEPLNRLDR